MFTMKKESVVVFFLFLLLLFSFSVYEVNAADEEVACNTFNAPTCPTERCKIVGSGCIDKVCTDYNAQTCPSTCQIVGSGCITKTTTTTPATKIVAEKACSDLTTT